jgi:hypothetical protein
MDQTKRMLYNNLGIEFIVTKALYFNNTTCTYTVLNLELNVPFTPQILWYQEASAHLVGCA